MKEHIQDEKKIEEIKVEEVKKDEYIEQQEENFKKQHQRYTENEKQKEMKESAADEDADLEAKLKEMEEEILREKLGEKRESVLGLAPELIPEKKKKELYKGRKPNAFPPSLLASLNEVIAWGDNVQAASSQPVQAAVQRLMEAKTEDEASLELALLINKSIKYLALRGEQWHWPGGNGIRRINTVKRLVKGLFSYAADQSSSYLQSVNNQVENLENFRNKKTANLYKKYMKEGLDLYNEKLGVSEEDTAEELQEARKVEEETQEENAGKFESEMAEAILRLELRNEPEYKRHNALVYKEDKKLNAKKVIRDIESFRIPDICSMSDREVLSYPNLDYMRHDEYLPLKLKFERLVAFGHIKDVDKIQRLRAKMRSFDQSLKLYEARLKVIAGEDDNPAKEEGTAKYKYEHMAGYGLSVDDMTENNLNDIKAAEEERFEAFPAMYREIYGKSPSKDELKKRRLIFEQGVSRKEYFNTGFEVRNKAADIDANLMTKDEEGKTVQLDRSLYGLFFYGFEEVPQYDEYEEKNLTVIHTTDDIKDLIKKITSKDQKERYKGYNTMIYFARGIDFSEFLDTSSDEAIFCDNAYKQTILQILSQVNATVEHMTKDGYPLRKEDRDLLNALGAMGLSINTTIGMTQSALNTANSELFTMAEIKKLSNMSNGLGEMTDNDDLNALITKLGSLKSESRDYDKGVDFDYLLRRSKAQYSGGSLTKEFISSRLALGRLKNKDYEAEIILKGEPFSKSLVKDALRTIKLYTPEKPVGTNRDDALDKIYKYESGRLQVEEMEAYLKKHGKTLTPEQQEIIDTQKKNYKLYAPYYKKMAELINSRGFVDMVNKGVYLDINQCLSPGAKLDDLKIMENNATTEEEKKTMVLWKELAEMFNEFTKEDAEICDALKINIFGEDAKKEINNFKKGMDPGQKMLIDKHNLNKFEEAIGNYFGTQAKKEDFTPDNHRIDMVYSESIGLLKGKSTSEMYEFYKKIGRKNNDCNKAQLKEKANAIEELFDEIMSWDMNEFNFKNDDELAENIGEKMLKAHLGMEMQTAVNNYKRMMVRKDVEGLKYNEDQLKDLQWRVDALHTIVKAMNVKADLAEYRNADPEIVKEISETRDYGQLCDKIPKLNARKGIDNITKAFLAKAPDIFIYRLESTTQFYCDTGKVKVVLDEAKSEVQMRIQNSPNDSLLPMVKAVDFTQLDKTKIGKTSLVLSPDTASQFKAKFGKEFKDKYSEKDRGKKLNDKRSELYKKDKNRNDLLKNIYPESKSFREDGLSDDEELYNEVKSYLSLASKDIDLSSDEKVVENSRQLEKILGMHRRFLYNVQKYPNFIKSLPKALGEKIMAHATKINLLTNYYRICRMIITDPLYSTRENKELGFSTKKDDSPERQRLSNLLMLKMQLEGKMRKITGEDVANAKSADGIHIESKTQRGFDGVLLDIKSAIGNKEFNKLTPHPGTENTKFGKVLMEAYRSARGNGNEGNELYKILCKNKDIRVDGEKITETLFREPYILANFRAMQGDDMTEDRFNEMIKNLGSKEEEEQLLGMKEVYRLVLDQARYIKKKYKGSFVFMNHAESKQHALEIQRDLQGVTNIYEFLRFFIKTPSLYKDEEGFNEVMELSEYFAGIMQHNGALAFASNFEQVTNNEPGFGNYMLYKAQLLAGSLDSNDRIDGLVSSNSILSLLEKQQDMQAEWDVVKEVVDTNKLFPKLNEGINSFMETCNMRKYKDSEGFYVDRELGALTSSMATLQVLFPLLDKAVKDKNAAVAKTYYGAAKPIFYNSIKGKCEEYLKNIKKSTESSKLIKKFSDTYLSDLTKYFDSIDAQVEELVKNAPKVERKTRNRQSVKVEEQDNGFNDKELRLPFPIEARLVEDDQIPKEEKEAETGYKKLRDDAETQMEKDLQSGAVKEEKFDGISYRRGRIENLKNELKLHREKDRSKLDAKKIAELDKNIARCEQRIKDHERMIPLLEKRKADNKIPQITVHDNKFDKSGLDVYGKVIENGELYPFENLMDGIKQGPSTCYYTSLLIGLIKQGNTDFIKNELVREYSPTQAIVKLHDEDGMPVEIIVDKSRTKTDHRPLWIVCLDKAVAVLLNKGGFDAEKRDELANAGSQAGYAADVDWEEFSRDENYCKDGSVFLKDVSKGSEDLAFKMIFGSVPIKFSTRGSEYVDGVVAKTEHVDEGDIAIGKIKALLKQGKVVNASTCSHLMPDFVPANLKKYEDNYFGAYDAVKFRASSHLQAEHTYLVYAVDEDRHVVKMVNPIMGNEIEVTFKNFRRHFTDVRAGA